MAIEHRSRQPLKRKSKEEKQNEEKQILGVFYIEEEKDEKPKETKKETPKKKVGRPKKFQKGEKK